jgi:hypothetical protein
MKWTRSKEDQSQLATDKPAPAEEISQQLERMIGDPVFRKSENLRNILTFLAQESITHPGANHKEHEIATRALGRSDDFDPRLDSTVRVHTARLRTKLAEYYASTGQNDPVMFDIPKGAYQLDARLREQPQASAMGPHENVAKPLARPRSRAFWAWMVAGVAASLAIYFWMDSRSKVCPPALGVFWADFMKPEEETTLVFSTPKMAATDGGGLRFVQMDPVSPDLLVETYAGTGEVYGIGALSGLFARYSKPARVKRGRLLTWDDARQQNLVFVGGPAVNVQLGELPELQRFRFVTTANGTFLRDSYINDVGTGTPQQVQYGHSRRPCTYDHAVIARMRRASNRAMLLLAGTTTVGTQAAVDFVVREETTKALLDALKTPHPTTIPGFEVLLSVKVSDGVPVHSRIVAVHIRR